MKYGEMIKKARKQLKLSQVNLSCQGLSKNLIGAVEQGSQNLTALRGMMIYERLLEHSLESQIMIDLSFDDLLLDQPRYIYIRDTYDYCKTILMHLKEKTPAENLNLLPGLVMHNTGIFKFFAFAYTAMYMKNKDKKQALHYYFEALECLKWLYPLEKESLFSRALREATPLGYEYKAFKKLAEYQALNIQQLEQENKTFSYNYYYNLAYFSLHAGLYQKAYDTITSYIAIKYLSQEDLIDAKLIQADALFHLSHFEKSILVLEESLFIINRSHYYSHHASCLSKLIIYICSEKTLSRRVFIEGYCLELIDVIKKTTTSNLSDCYFALCLGFYTLSNNQSALYYLRKLMETSPHAFHAYHQIIPHLILSQQENILLEMLETIDTNNLESNEHIAYLELLLKCEKSRD